jgi:hypothetical protein
MKIRKRKLREECITAKIRKRDSDFVLLNEVVIFDANRKKMRYVVRVALLSEKRIEFKVFVGKPEGKSLKDLRVCGRVKFTLVVRKKRMGYFGLDCSGWAQGQVMGFINTALIRRFAQYSRKYLY